MSACSSWSRESGSLSLARRGLLAGIIGNVGAKHARESKKVVENEIRPKVFEVTDAGIARSSHFVGLFVAHDGGCCRRRRGAKRADDVKNQKDHEHDEGKEASEQRHKGRHRNHAPDEHHQGRSSSSRRTPKARAEKII